MKIDYYSHNGELKISCECGNLKFPDKEEYNRFVTTYCGSMQGWERCTLAKERLSYYDRKG